MPSPLPGSRKFPWIIYWIVLLLIAVIALTPVASVVVSGWVAHSHGCQLDEGSSHPCLIDGKDYGETLTTMFVLGWLMLLTLPAGAVMSTGWLTVLLIHRSQGPGLDRAASARGAS
jgi:ABC-type Fe3+ transport system permease subunit